MILNIMLLIIKSTIYNIHHSIIDFLINNGTHLDISDKAQMASQFMEEDYIQRIDQINLQVEVKDIKKMQEEDEEEIESIINKIIFFIELF